MCTSVLFSTSGNSNGYLSSVEILIGVFVVVGFGIDAG